MSDEHPWVKLCELAMCSPDFDVVRRFNRAMATIWLMSRLADHGHIVPIAKVRTAYDSWTEHLRQAKATGINLGTMRLDP